MRRPDRVLVIFAKWPRAGRGKRRLAREVGTAVAARIAHAFLRDTIAIGARSGADRVLIAYAPPSARSRFSAMADAAALVPQPRASFGARLERALADGLAVGRRVVLIGADSPTLPPAVIRRAFDRLSTADVVLGPADDGGYYLIGARGCPPATLFRRMRWSTGDVAAETLRRTAAAGLAVVALPRWYDVDDGVGLRRLLTDRHGLARASATREALAAAGLRA